MEKRIFVTSTGTGIGKTYVTSHLIRNAIESGRSVEAYKPVISGFDENAISETDTGIILGALGRSCEKSNIDIVSPWRYVAPLAPSMAARMENRMLDYQKLIEHARKVASRAVDLILMEGVGGVMVPLTDQRTVLDWIADSEFDTLLVTGDYLGSLSHTLTALEVLKSRGIKLLGVVVNQNGDVATSVEGTSREIRLWAGDVPVWDNFRNAAPAKCFAELLGQ